MAYGGLPQLEMTPQLDIQLETSWIYSWKCQLDIPSIYVFYMNGRAYTYFLKMNIETNSYLENTCALTHIYRKPILKEYPTGISNCISNWFPTVYPTGESFPTGEFNSHQDVGPAMPGRGCEEHEADRDPRTN